MDLLDFGGREEEALYFNEDSSAEVEQLLQQAADSYGEGDSEMPLLRAYLRAPQSLSVLVSLYRFYYYQHRLEETLVVAHHALSISGKRLGFPESWSDLTPDHIRSDLPMGLMRFYLLALKGAAYVNLRLERLDEGEQMLDIILALDPENRLGATVLKDVLKETRQRLRLVVSN